VVRRTGRFRAAKTSVPAVVLVAASVLIGSCSGTLYNMTTYPDDAVDRDQVALVEGTSAVRMYQIDDRTAPDEHMGFSSEGSGKFRMFVTPGTHTLSVGCRDSNLAGAIADGFSHRETGTSYRSYSPKPLEFEAAAGHTYRLKYQRDGQNWIVYVEDEAPDRTVTILEQTAQGRLEPVVSRYHN